MVFGTFRIYGYRLCFAVRGFRKRCSRARFRDSFAACFAVRGFRACVLLFEAFGSDVPKARFREAEKIVFVDSKGNVKEFFGSGVGRFRLEAEKMFLWIPKVTWKSFLAPVLAVFGSCPDGVWDFSHLGLKARFREAQKIVVVDSKGNVKEFFGSGFGRFWLVS